MTLGEKIKDAREKKNLSQEELALQLGVSRQAVSKWENDNSIPQGVNREMLINLLDLPLDEKPIIYDHKSKFKEILGWIIAALLTIIVVIVFIVFQRNDTPQTPSIKSITFYDSNQNIVTEEALWYNSANIESILIQWDGPSPDNIKMFSTPSGSDTISETELLLTKPVLDGDNAELLNADKLKEFFMSHVYFQLDYGYITLTSDLYNVFYDESLTQ